MRQQRISSLLQTEIADILLRSVNDQRIKLLSITEVKITKDFARAEVYYSQIASEEEKRDTIKALRAASSFIHAELSKRIRYMAVPKLVFKFDPRLERNMSLINEIRQQNTDD